VTALYGSPQTRKEADFRYDPANFDVPDNSTLIGCWQTEKYFADIAPILREELILKSPVRQELQPLIRQLVETTSVSIHVRRGDYLHPNCVAYHGNLGMDYYTRAIEYVRGRVPNPTFYVFSDDPSGAASEWCSANMPGEIVSGNNPTEDLYLLSQCQHSIIANSSFSWWGCWMAESATGNDRIAVAPQRWFNEAPLDSSDVVPERWIKL